MDTEAYEPREAAADTGAALVGVGIGASIGGPVGAVVGALATPATKFALSKTVSFLQGWRLDRVEKLVQLSANEAGISADLLLERLDADPVRRDLLIRTLRVAQDASLDRVLIALSRALASGAAASDESTVLWEQAFVAALGSLAPAHWMVLQRFTMSSNRLGLSDGVTADFDKPVETMNEVQLRRVCADCGDVIDSVVAVLQAHGLLSSRSPGSGSFSVGPGPVYWTITSFGNTALERLELVGATVAGPADDPS